MRENNFGMFRIFLFGYNIMSLFLQSSTGSNGVTMDRGAGIYTVNYNPYAIESENTFSNAIAKPRRKREFIIWFGK